MAAVETNRLREIDDSTQSLPPIFALVIGINTYSCPDYDSLASAVPDAVAVESFLKGTLNIPPDNIISLHDDKATRGGILQAFNELISIDTQGAEAAYIIYFAGHGATCAKPEEWSDWVTPGDDIEQICPSDIGLEVDGKIVTGIPDRTVSVFLNRLAEEKGNNITLILDCCFSGGLNRSPNSIPRQIFHPPPIPADCDQELWAQEWRGMDVARGFCGKYRESHVLLAACGPNELAYENPKTGRGFFTGALLSSLMKFGVENLTYTSLIHGLVRLPRQTPHCEGHHVNRRLFNKAAPPADRSFILAEVDKKTGRCCIRSGAAQGVTPRSTFGVHLSNLSPDNEPLGTLIVNEVSAFTSEMVLPEGSPFEIPSRFYAKLITRATQEMYIYSPDRSWLESLFPPESCADLSIQITDDPQEAVLRLSIDDNDQVHLERNDPMVTPFIGAEFPHTINKDDVQRLEQVIECYAHFNHHLTRTGEEFDGVRMELRMMNVECDENFDEVLIPVGRNLIEEEPATIIVDEDATLGVTLINQTDQRLYPYLFYFDPSDLVIVEWYTPPFGPQRGNNDIEPPLLPNSSLAIGYGNGGALPWKFTLRDEINKDVGFLKLFLTTSPVDFSALAQDSPFEGVIESPSRDGDPLSERWGSKLSTIVQLRYPSSE